VARTDEGRRRRLGEILIDGGVIDEGQLQDALAAQSSSGRRRRLGSTIVGLGFASEEKISEALATQLRLETVDLSAVGPEPSALTRVPRKLAERHEALPLRLDADGTLHVAMSDPTNVVALDDIKLAAGVRSVRPVIATTSALELALTRAYGSDQAALEMVGALGDADVVVSRQEREVAVDDAGELDDQPIIRLANAILADAVRTRASDVHVEPEREHVRVRYRVDGLLRETMRVPRHIGPALTSRLKIMSNLDIAERRRPQDGRSMIRVASSEVDLRVSTMPTMFGETVVMRLLRKGSERMELDDLAMSPDVRERFESALARPQGLIVITGPTGSGKTTTLYAGLGSLVDEVRNIITLEDPIEYQIQGINQTQVNPKIDLTFARGLRTVLRQDPDVVMVGEIRDRETAELAMEASFTGHLVLSTLHTNDAPSTIVRLVDLGVERFLIASSLLLIVAQRLARVVCPHCAEPSRPDERTLRLLGLTPDDIDGHELVAGAGCQVCDTTGYLGRLGLYETLQVTPRMRELIVEGGSELQLSALARTEGMRTLREDGMAKAFAGLTTLAEVARVTPEQSLRTDRARADADRIAELASTITRSARVPRDVDVEDLGEDLDIEVTPVTEDDEDALLAIPTTRSVRPVTPYGDSTLRVDDVTGMYHGGTVLVIDDDPSIRGFLGALLDEDWILLEAADGQTGLDLHKVHRPDLVLLDLHLPDLEGQSVAEQIRADDRRRRVPIIAITGDDEVALHDQALAAGVDDVIVKPFDEADLYACIQRQMQRKFGG
jgi:type II secretory ATPase GspE/PulE/Tfp pilus assembly ATPase PilB-like protein/ActR/RegA family two-component response regulator